jgi:hypothetical protein
MAGDPRQADVDEAQALLAQADETAGAVLMPALAAAELYVLGGGPGPLVDADVWSWWTGHAEADRAWRERLAWQFLAHRKLIGPLEPGAVPQTVADVRVDPALGMILAGRTRPSFIVLRREGARGTPDRLRMYGIAEEGRGLRAVLTEEVTGKQAGALGREFKYALSSAASAGKAMARWAGRPAARAALGRRPPKLIAVYPPGAGTRAVVDQIEVRAGPDGLRVQHEPPGRSAPPPVTCDEDALGRLVAGILTGVSR